MVRLASQLGWYPLTIASKNGHREVVERLIAAGAKLDANEVNPSTRLAAVPFATELQDSELFASPVLPLLTRTRSPY